MQSGWFSKLNNMLTWRKTVNLDVWALLESRLNDRSSSACLLQQLADTNLQKKKQIWDEQWSPCRELPHSVTSCIRHPQMTEKHPSKMLNATKWHFALEIRAFPWQPTMDRCSAVTVTNMGSVALNTSESGPIISQEKSLSFPWYRF